jgi:Uma2 family endonuclease
MTEIRAPESPRKALPEGPVSYDEFLEWAGEDTRAEWVDGDIVFTSPISDAHQDIVEFFLTLLRLHVEHHRQGWVRSSTFQMKLDVIPSGREPDIVYLREEHRDRMTGTYIDGPADMAVEVVSPESGPRDRGENFYEYEAAGVPEYWLVDPDREELTVYRLEEDRYRTAFEGREGRAESEVVDGFWIDTGWLWQEQLPPVLDVLRRWDIL